MAYASLTPTGRRRLAEMRATAEEAAAEVFAARAWSGEDVALLSGLLTRLGGAGLDGR
ncbi:hypothetical protein [Streptomyces monashensis]|uniref:hypothetical protein n=1 Tax=Streptomyces monashensis TaxID=1678012 RepID=UPI001FEA5426|nr:hypothetical protein [Streptomyces monashensis]